MYSEILIPSSLKVNPKDYTVLTVLDAGITHTCGITCERMNITALHVHASEQTSMCMNTVEYTGAQTQRLQAAAALCTRAEATSPPSCDSPGQKNVYFSTQECGCYIFLTQKLCLYFNTQGLCVTELLFRGFWLNDCCVKRWRDPTSFIVLFIVLT